MKRKCDVCRGDRFILADNDIHGLRIERCDKCSTGKLTDDEAVRKAYRLAVRANKKRTIRIHVLGGVAYPPERIPKNINLVIEDHDNDGR